MKIISKRFLISIIIIGFFVIALLSFRGKDNDTDKEAGVVQIAMEQEQGESEVDKQGEPIAKLTEKTEQEIIVESTIEGPQTELHTVIKVIDGDTIAVEIDGKTETLRLIGIDTPETVHPNKPVQCFGIEASSKAKETLSGQTVRLEADTAQGERDKYGRLLRYIFLENGTNFNKMMIVQGYAFEYTYQGIPYQYQTEFKQAEEKARAAKLGLWADDACAGEAVIDTPQITPLTDCYCESNKYNCPDFKTHQEAQALFDCCVQQVGSDVHRLDRDEDGVACEGLP